jgi:hypothetical protein
VVILLAVVAYGLFMTWFMLSSRSGAGAGAGVTTRSTVAIIFESEVPGPGSRLDRLQAALDTWGNVDAHDTPFLCVLFDTRTEYEEAVRGLEGSFSVISSNDHPRHWRRLVNALSHALQEFRYAKYFLLGNDHTFVAPGNFACFLSTLNPSELVYTGHIFDSIQKQYDLNAIHPDCRLVSLPAGVVLTRASAELLAQRWTEETDISSPCYPGSIFFTMDVMMAMCLASLGVVATDARDQYGRQRFSIYGPVRAFNHEVDDWYRAYHDESEKTLEMSLTSPITFHYVGPDEARILYQFLYPEQHDLVQARIEYSSSRKIGGYGRPPDVTDEVFFDFLKSLNRPFCA